MVYGRVPPQAKEFEEAVLGAIMLEKSAIDRVADILPPEAFYVDAHQRIFRSILALHAKNHPVDLLAVTEQLRTTNDLEEAGGPYYVTRLTNIVVSAANLEYHARIILQKFIQRELIRVAGEIIGEAYEDGTDVFDLLDRSETSILGIGTRHSPTTEKTIRDVLVKAIQTIEEWRHKDSDLTGVASGFPDLDRATRGWQGGDLVIIAARPSVGKTAFALNLIRKAALDGVPVAVWSLEMKALQLVLRMLAAESKILLSKIQTGNLTDQDMGQLFREGVAKLDRMGIFFDDEPGLTIAKIRAKARRMKKKYGIGLIVVDYLQLMEGEGLRGSNREQEIAKISRALKLLAQELNIPVIALSQLSRDVEKRQGKAKVPQLSDLRESGAIEQDADLVILLYPPSEDEILQDASKARRRYARIAKQRNGFLITQELDFRNEIQFFEHVANLLAPQSTQMDLVDYSEPRRQDGDDMPF